MKIIPSKGFALTAAVAVSQIEETSSSVYQQTDLAKGKGMSLDDVAWSTNTQIWSN